MGFYHLSKQKKGLKFEKILTPRKEADDMKNMIFLGCIIIVLASMVFVSCATMQKIAISEGNLAQLKGKWTGSRSPDPSLTLITDLEISNDSYPVQGKLIFHEARMPGNFDTTNIIDFKEGTITDKGNLLITESAIKAELSLYKDDGKIWLWGSFSFSGKGGTMLLKKK